MQRVGRRFRNAVAAAFPDGTQRRQNVFLSSCEILRRLGELRGAFRGERGADHHPGRPDAQTVHEYLRLFDIGALRVSRHGKRDLFRFPCRHADHAKPLLFLDDAALRGVFDLDGLIVRSVVADSDRVDDGFAVRHRLTRFIVRRDAADQVFCLAAADQRLFCGFAGDRQRTVYRKPFYVITQQVQLCPVAAVPRREPAVAGIHADRAFRIEDIAAFIVFVAVEAVLLRAVDELPFPRVQHRMAAVRRPFKRDDIARFQQRLHLIADRFLFFRRFPVRRFVIEHAVRKHVDHMPRQIRLEHVPERLVVAIPDERGTVQKQRQILRPRFRRGKSGPPRAAAHEPIHAQLVVLHPGAPGQIGFRGSKQNLCFLFVVHGMIPAKKAACPKKGGVGGRLPKTNCFTV